MDPITVNSTLSAICYIGIFVGILVILAWLIIEKGKANVRNENEYKFYYKRTQGFIRGWGATENNYYIISGCVDHIKSLKFKNPEKTEVLSNEFIIKYQSVRDEINSREEFDPGQVLK
jgi:hypothetical protein